MSAFSNIWIHLIWSTKFRQPQLRGEMKEATFGLIARIMKDMNVWPDIINGPADHIHVLAKLPTTLSVADLVQKLKSRSSRVRNEEAGHVVLKWQSKYAALSANPYELDRLRNYIANQEAHHKVHTFKEELRSILDELGMEYDEKYMWE